MGCWHSSHCRASSRSSSMHRRSSTSTGHSGCRPSSEGMYKVLSVPLSLENLETVFYLVSQYLNTLYQVTSFFEVSTCITLFETVV